MIAIYHLTNNSGIAIEIIDDMNDIVYFRWISESTKTNIHQSKIIYDERPYFWANALKIYFDECMRV